VTSQVSTTLPPGEPRDADPRHADIPTGSRNALEVTRMHTSRCPAGGHLVPGNDLIGKHHLTVGEGGQHREDALPELLTSECAAGSVVTREVPGKELVDGIDISTPHDLVERSLHDAAVGLVHEVPPDRAQMTSSAAWSNGRTASCPDWGIQPGYLWVGFRTWRLLVAG
jgi:hypothetical protein